MPTVTRKTSLSRGRRIASSSSDLPPLEVFQITAWSGPRVAWVHGSGVPVVFDRDIGSTPYIMLYGDRRFLKTWIELSPEERRKVTIPRPRSRRRQKLVFEEAGA